MLLDHKHFLKVCPYNSWTVSFLECILLHPIHSTSNWLIFISSYDKKKKAGF